jgi:GMC oxidoreductase
MTTRSNLRVETHAQATRILFEGKRAVGVEYRKAKELKQIRARREVIVSSGAFQTPQLLLLSGVGDTASLAKHGIAATQHLPGVGQNLQDHPDFVFGFTSDSPHFAGLSFGGIARIFKGIAQFRRERRGPMTSNVAECGGFLKTRPDLDAPDIQLHFCMAMIDDHGRKPRWGTGFSCHVCLLRPESRGSVWLQSADPAQAPAIDPNFLGAEADVDAMVAGFKMTKRLLDAPALKALQTSEYRRHRERRGYPESPAPARRYRLSPGRHLQDGRQRSIGGGRSEAEGLRARRPARRRCLCHADPDRRQYQRADHHDRRESRRHDQGRDAGGVKQFPYPSLRANGSRECAPDDRLREAIHSSFVAWIASLRLQ